MRFAEKCGIFRALWGKPGARAASLGLIAALFPYVRLRYRAKDGPWTPGGATKNKRARAKGCENADDQKNE
jgi:hypothetical protein